MDSEAQTLGLFHEAEAVGTESLQAAIHVPELAPSRYTHIRADSRTHVRTYTHMPSSSLTTSVDLFMWVDFKDFGLGPSEPPPLMKRLSVKDAAALHDRYVRACVLSFSDFST